MTKEEKIWLGCSVVLAGFLVALVFHYTMGMYLGARYPKNTFLFDPKDVGRDFTHIFEAVKTGSPYSYRWSLYFPFTYVPLFALWAFSPLTAYLILMGIFVLFALHLVHTHLAFLPSCQRFAATLVLCFLSYPILFCIDRGNVEALVFMFLYGFLICYRRDALGWAAFFLACATAMKMYPGVFIVLFLARKQYWPVVATGGLVAFLSLASAASYPGGVGASLASLSAKLVEYKQLYIIGPGGWAFGSSYFGVLKIVLYALHHGPAPDQVMRALPFYTVACLGAFAFVAWYVIFVEKTFWKQVALLTFSMILLPQVSSDYKLIHLFFPFCLFITSESRDRKDFLFTLLFGLLLVPKAYVWLRNDLSISAVLNPLLMTAIIVVILFQGIVQWRGLPPIPLAAPGPK